ncbi:helix-turn-helix domain-containing protein [Pandoraea oxalativorans]|uniref:helix-turn-helix domain-containing protein n=1 Tax=Pandoraea oxalativorans TaxID=573737 RepID=UPI000A014B0B
MQTNPLALFGDHLARLRKARGWSQEKLALESGLARSYVSGIERGRRNVALVNICVLADTLGVPTSEMLRFAPAAGSAEDTALASERTPLPQISRSLCKLENRDQVWLAEIIRSLSSRLSHAAPPATTSAYASSSHGTASVGAHSDAFDDDTRDDSGDLDAEFPVRHQPSSASPTRYPALSEASSEANMTRADAQTSEVPHRIDDPDRRQDDEMNRSPRAAAAPGSNAVAQEDPLRWPARREERG